MVAGVGSRDLERISIRIYYGIAIAVTVRSLDYYYKPTSAIQIDGLNSYVYLLL